MQQLLDRVGVGRLDQECHIGFARDELLAIRRELIVDHERILFRDVDSVGAQELPGDAPGAALFGAGQDAHAPQLAQACGLNV